MFYNVSRSQMIFTEKLLVAKILMELSYDNRLKRYTMDYDSCLKMLLNKKEASSYIMIWYINFFNINDWEEKIYPMIENVLNLPRCPQKFKDAFNIPIEKKLEDDQFNCYYNKLYKKFFELLNKYEKVYKNKLTAKLARGAVLDELKSLNLMYVLVSPKYRNTVR